MFFASQFPRYNWFRFMFIKFCGWMFVKGMRDNGEWFCMEGWLSAEKLICVLLEEKERGEKENFVPVTSQSQWKEGQQSKKRSGQKYTLALFIHKTETLPFKPSTYSWTILSNNFSLSRHAISTTLHVGTAF